MRRKHMLISVVVLAVLVTFSLCYADENAIYGCYKKTDGQLRIVKSATQCLPSERPISWNMVGPPGQPGADGVSVESTPVPEGDPNCGYGGIQFSSSSGNTFLCNGGTGEGSLPTLRRIEPEATCTPGVGWCPNGYMSEFSISDPVVTGSSVISMTITHPTSAMYRGCEATTIKAGEFRVFCTGWGYVEKGAILNYAVFNVQ